MGAIGHDGLAVPGRVVLAHEPPFRLGLAGVHPPTRQIHVGARSETLEPRVMQVLVALARASGAIVTRDELIEYCWDGRIVGEDAINRVLSRIRRIGEGIGQGSFGVETITKVGYRLRVGAGDERRDAALPAAEAGRSSISTSRRAWIAGGASLIAAGAAGLAWLRPWQHRPPAEAEDLYRRAEIAWKAGLQDQSRQAVDYLERAVQIDPLYSDAWGAIALAYTHYLEGYAEAEMASVPGRIRSAAGRALALDRDNADAQLALISIRPGFRNWARAEREHRELVDRHPGHWLAHGRLAMLLYEVGRLDEGIAQHRKALSIDPMIPLPYVVISNALANLDRTHEAEDVLDQARRKWPTHPMVWHARFFQLLFSGRPQAALAAAIAPDSRPSGLPQQQIDYLVRLAKAVDGQKAADIDAIVEEERLAAMADAASIAFAAKIFALFGRLDLTFASLERYYLDRGSFGGPAAIGPLTRRRTDLLFSRPMATARNDARFPQLLTAIGLERYWRGSNTLPDYRRP